VLLLLLLRRLPGLEARSCALGALVVEVDDEVCVALEGEVVEGVVAGDFGGGVGLGVVGCGGAVG
jgi:hypothetical protein